MVDHPLHRSSRPLLVANWDEEKLLNFQQLPPHLVFRFLKSWYNVSPFLLPLPLFPALSPMLVWYGRTFWFIVIIFLRLLKIKSTTVLVDYCHAIRHLLNRHSVGMAPLNLSPLHNNCLIEMSSFNTRERQFFFCCFHSFCVGGKIVLYSNAPTTMGIKLDYIQIEF